MCVKSGKGTRVHKAIVWRFKELRRTSSTQDRVRELAHRGEPEGMVLSAREQSSGRGRYGRTWLSPVGGLYMSVLLRPARSDGLQLIPLIGALAVMEGIRVCTGADSRLRWPNDVVIGGKKLAGVIAEAEHVGGRVRSVILGIGVNCNLAPTRLGEYSQHSTTLMAVLGRRIRIGALKREIARSLQPVYSEWNKGADEAIIGRIELALDTLGRRVTFETNEGRRGTARAERLLSDGALLVRRRGGTHTVLRAEQIGWLRDV